MQQMKAIGLFSAGLICGLVIHWMPSTSVSAAGDRASQGASAMASGGGGGCIGDIAPSPNGNGVVDIDDLVAVITHWGACPVIDVDGDGYTVLQGDCDDHNPALHPGAPELCNGIDDNCDGNTDEGLGGRPCVVEVGACSFIGVTVCDGAGGISCLAKPNPETCNGIDDDCDGEIDEGLGLGQPCFAGIGACQVVGVTVCDGNGGITCSAIPGTPRTEICGNLIDDDCDGSVDEGCP